VRLHRDLEAQLLFARAPRRASLGERLYGRTRSRLNHAGLDGWSIRRFILLSLLVRLGGAFCDHGGGQSPGSQHVGRSGWWSCHRELRRPAPRMAAARLL
jgi:hypothetical protein